MKIRQANKILRENGRGRHYRKDTLNHSLKRYTQTARAMEADRYWCALMDYIGPMGRAELSFDLKLKEKTRENWLSLEDR